MMPPATRARPDVQCLVDFRYAPVALFAARSIPLPDGNSSCFHGGAGLREGVSIRRKRREGRLHWRMPTPPTAHNSCPRVAARYLVIEVAGDAADRLRAVRVTGSPRTPSSRSRRSSSTVASPRPLWPPPMNCGQQFIVAAKIRRRDHVSRGPRITVGKTCLLILRERAPAITQSCIQLERSRTL
jgi:hypothetical protein